VCEGQYVEVSGHAILGTQLLALRDCNSVEGWLDNGVRQQTAKLVEGVGPQRAIRVHQTPLLWDAKRFSGYWTPC
jgi:hypothetical protein